MNRSSRSLLFEAAPLDLKKSRESGQERALHSAGLSPRHVQGVRKVSMSDVIPRHPKSPFQEQGSHVLNAARSGLKRLSIALVPPFASSHEPTMEWSAIPGYDGRHWKDLPELPYHALRRSARWQIMALVCLAGATSPLDYSTYSPALSQIADELHAKIAVVTLSITTTVIMSGLAPSVWGPLADTVGRRQILIYSILLSTLACLGLATMTRNVTVLIVLKGVQAAGSASVLAIGAYKSSVTCLH